MGLDYNSKIYDQMSTRRTDQNPPTARQTATAGFDLAEQAQAEQAEATTQPVGPTMTVQTPFSITLDERADVEMTVEPTEQPVQTVPAQTPVITTNPVERSSLLPNSDVDEESSEEEPMPPPVPRVTRRQRQEQERQQQNAQITEERREAALRVAADLQDLKARQKLIQAFLRTINQLNKAMDTACNFVLPLKGVIYGS